VALISPPPHHDIYSIEDLAQLIYDLKNANRDARINVKLVSEAGVGTIASGVAKAGAQVILISGYDGGTGAAPGSSIHNAGLPWELGLTEAHRCLTENGLRDRVVLETDGKLMSGRDVAIASLLGAEEFGFATAPLVTLGCMMMRVCSKDTCPVGIATQNKTLRSCFKGKPEYVTRFMLFIAEQVREIMAQLGFSSMAEMTGRSDCLRVRKELITDRAFKVDMGQILGEQPLPVLSQADRESGNYGLYAPKNLYDFELEKTPDMAVLLPAFEEGMKKLGGKATSGVPCTFETSLKVSSTDRSFGTIFGSEITKRFGGSLAEDTFVVRASGGGGQSFGAFVPKGVTIRLTGDANDGFGKGLSGGKLVLVPDPKSRFDASQNIIVGNVALYGATAGKAFINGVAGERFCVRNSGAVAVAEGCGDHGLEYMTGGRAVILGRTGKNFAAGMSGGIAYVLDQDHSLYKRINKDMVALQELTEKYDIAELGDILTEYVAETGSKLGRQILDDFEAYIPFFKKVVPLDYQRMLTAIGRYEEQGIPHDKAVLEAFQEM
jgi:glutamate synthase (ferredoxin)